MKGFLERMLRSYAPLVVGLLLFLLFWGGRLGGFSGEPLPESSLSIFGLSVPLSPLAGGIVSMVLYAISAYLLSRIIGEYQLYNTRTHFPTGLFLGLVAASSFLIPFPSGGLCLVLVLFMLYVLMSTYQRRDAVGEYVIGFSLFSLASIFFPKWLLFVPVLLVGGNMLQSLTPRTFMAAVIGLIVPYWIGAGVLFMFDKLSLFVVPFEELIRFDAIVYSGLTLRELAAAFMLLFLAIPGFVLFPSTLFSIKEKARVCYQFMLLMAVAVLLFMLLQPTLFSGLFPMLTGIACLFVTQMLISSKSRMGGVYLLLLVVFFVAYCTLPLWEASVPF